MDKASIIQDAIAYIEELHEEERQMLADISRLESAGGCTAVVKTENVVSVGSQAEQDGAGFSPPKKMRRTASASSIDDAICSPATCPVQVLEVIIGDLSALHTVPIAEC
jgi:hypothetical protein